MLERHTNAGGLFSALCFAALLLGRTIAGTVPLPSYPLAVKNPYLSTWLPGNYTSDVATAQPEFWYGQSLTWPILARVDGTTYVLFGAPAGVSGATAATTNSIAYTSSHTLIYVTAGSAQFELDFFSPVLPGTNSYVEQSLPYSYLTITANSTGAELQVEILTGIDYTWTGQGGASALTQETYSTTTFFQWHNDAAILFTENDQQASYGTLVFGITGDSGASVTQTCGAAADVYSAFVASGTLTAASTCDGTDLAAFAKTLYGVTSSTNASVTIAVGLDRIYAINYLGEPQTGLYRSQYPDIGEAVSFFLSNYGSAYYFGGLLDEEVRSKSEAVSDDWGSQYADIVEASVRQTFGAIELTVPLSNTSASPQVFLKEISSDGNVNTVDVIYQSWPIFISLNPVYIRLLFQPIISYLESGLWPNDYVIHDIGTNYPNATGHNLGNDESMPLFETSTLFILFYAYEKYTGDAAWAAQYSSLLTTYAQYLVDNSLYPASQLTSVDAIAAAANQTALAIQASIGLNAAGILLGDSSFTSTAASYATEIYDNALGLDGDTLAASTHFTYYYGQDTTWNVLFAAFSDILLNLSTFPAAAWDLQSTWYLSQLQEEGLPFAGPVTDLSYTGTGITWGLSDWNIVAAAASTAAVQSEVVNTTHVFLTNGLNTIPFGTKYYVEGPDVGKWIANEARSTVGSDFAIIALKDGWWYGQS